MCYPEATPKFYIKVILILTLSKQKSNFNINYLSNYAFLNIKILLNFNPCICYFKDNILFTTFLP